MADGHHGKRPLVRITIFPPAATAGDGVKTGAMGETGVRGLFGGIRRR